MLPLMVHLGGTHAVPVMWRVRMMRMLMGGHCVLVSRMLLWVVLRLGVGGVRGVHARMMGWGTHLLFVPLVHRGMLLRR